MIELSKSKKDNYDYNAYKKKKYKSFLFIVKKEDKELIEKMEKLRKEGKLSETIRFLIRNNIK